MGPTSPLARSFFCTAQQDADANWFLSDRVPFRFVEREDTVAHTASAGDTWWSLAGRYYAGVPDAASLLWYVIADFQPAPVVDPTIAILPGTIVYVPSLQTVLMEIVSEARRDDFQA